MCSVGGVQVWESRVERPEGRGEGSRVGCGLREQWGGSGQVPGSVRGAEDKGSCQACRWGLWTLWLMVLGCFGGLAGGAASRGEGSESAGVCCQTAREFW